LFSSEVGNFMEPALLGKGFFIKDKSFVNIRSGTLYEQLYKKSLKPGNAKIEKRIYAGTFTLNICELLDLYTQLGSMKLESKFNSSHKKDDSFVATTGAKVILIKVKNTAFGADVKYQISHSFCFREWQIAAGLSHKIYIFVPYAGITFTGTKVKIKESDVSKNFENKNRIGITVGASITLGPLFYANIEGRLVDETAFSTSFETRF